MTERLRVLHVLASRRATGIAEPVLCMCEALAARGHAATLALPRASKLVREARARGLAVWDGLRLASGWNFFSYLSDFHRLRACAGDCDVVHLHHTRTHWLGGLALGNLAVRPLLLAHNHDSHPLRGDLLHRRLYDRMDGLLEVSTTACAVDAQRLARPGYHLPGAVDVEKITPEAEGREIRRRLGIPAEAMVVASWSRLDPDRRHDVLLAAFALLAREFPAAWLLFAGSGEHRGALLRRARELGVADRLVVAGRNDLAFAEARAITDVLVFLATGSDGSCRTVLEGMAAGLPIVAARVGVVGDYLCDGENGLLIEQPAPAQLAAALRRVLGDGDLRARLAYQARADAVARFDLRLQAARLEAIYLELRKALQKSP
ncbi:glycosyltransferase family 4 protein [bacterium]|nr:glycosyltransferase family 4 protein [bacterium]